MTITVNTKSYGIDSFKTKDESVYSGPANTMLVRDELALKRSKSAATSSHNGYARVEARFTRTFTCLDGSKRDGFMAFYTSIPVDAVSTDVDSLRDDLGDLIISTNGQDLVNKLDINQ